MNIGAAIGRSGAAVRRWLNEMMEGGLLSLRCEVAQPITGWPIATKPAARAEVRLCAAVTGSDNLVMTLWLRSLGDIQRVEAELATSLPQPTLTDRAVTLRAVKRTGCLLSESGHTTEVVGISP